MACKNGKCPADPKVTSRNIEPNMVVIEDATNYYDNGGHDNNRVGQWIIYLNGEEAARTDEKFLFDSVAIGQDSTCKVLFLPNGVDDLVAYLDSVGVTAVDGDEIAVGRTGHGVDCRTPTKLSNTIKFTYTIEAPTYTFMVVDNTGALLCPVDYAATTFDLTPFGGGASEVFADEAALLTQMATLNDAGGNAYTLDAGSCTVQVISNTAPTVTVGNIVGTVADPLYSFPVVDSLGALLCPVDYAATTFDLTPFGGGASEVFADEAALLTQMATLNDAGGNAYTLNTTTCALEVNSATPPAVTTGNVVGTVAGAVLYSFPVLNGGASACPIDFTVTVFDLTLFGGGGQEESFADEAALVARVQTLNAAGAANYIFNAATCSVDVSSTTAPTVTTGDINSVIAVLYEFPLQYADASSPCPIQCPNTSFDLSPFGGSANFVPNGAECIGLLIVEMQNINAAGFNFYQFNATNCSLEVLSTTPPAVTTSPIVITETFIYPLVDNVAAGLCPIDYALTTFDLTQFGGGASEVFADETALLTQMATLNDAGGNAYTLDAVNCTLEVSSNIPPSVESIDIVGTVLVEYAFPVVNGGGTSLCPVDYPNTTFDLTPFGGGATEAFGNEAALLLQMAALNDAGGNAYTFDSVACEVKVASSTPPAVTTGNVVGTLTLVTYDFPVVDGLGASLCPIDYATTTFDLTLFSGGAAESFANEAALLTQLAALNDAGGNAYTLNTATCIASVDSVTPPAVTNGNIVGTVTPQVDICTVTEVEITKNNLWIDPDPLIIGFNGYESLPIDITGPNGNHLSIEINEKDAGVGNGPNYAYQDDLAAGNFSDFIIDWGDGNSDTFTDAVELGQRINLGGFPITHVYAADGFYTGTTSYTSDTGLDVTNQFLVIVDSASGVQARVIVGAARLTRVTAPIFGAPGCTQQRASWMAAHAIPGGVTIVFDILLNGSSIGTPNVTGQMSDDMNNEYLIGLNQAVSTATVTDTATGTVTVLTSTSHFTLASV